MAQLLLPLLLLLPAAAAVAPSRPPAVLRGAQHRAPAGRLRRGWNLGNTLDTTNYNPGMNAREKQIGSSGGSLEPAGPPS